MLAGNVVTTAIREASLREQIAPTEEIVAAAAHGSSRSPSGWYELGRRRAASTWSRQQR